MLNHIRNIFYGIFFIVLMISTSVLGKSTESRAAKYNYVVNDGKADKVSAGTNYNLSDGWVGCPDTIYGLPVNSIEADGFSGWGSDYASAYVPVYCNIIGPKAFYSINEYTTHPAKYLGGVTMPARFWRYYEYIGFTPETPLYSNAGDIFCDVNQRTFVYNASSQKPKDYAVYIDGINMGDAHEFLTDTVNAGTHTVRFPVVDVTTGNVNKTGVYYGTTTYEIMPYNLANAKCREEINETYCYTGKPIKPNPVLYSDWGNLNSGSDSYSLVYENHINAGTALVKAVAGGNNNFTGEWTKTFTIKPASLSLTTIHGFEENVSYSGKEHIQNITLAYEGMTLQEGTDYTVTYSNNQNAGTAAMIITGMGNYAETITKKFVIKPKVLEESILAISMRDKYYFTSPEFAKPAPAIFYNDKELVRDVDYRLSWTDEGAVQNVDENVRGGKIVITGIGNYVGVIEKEFLYEISEHADNMSGTLNTLLGIEKKSTSHSTNSTNITNITTNSSVVKQSGKKRYIRFYWNKVKKAKKYRIMLRQTYYSKKGKKSVKYKVLTTTKRKSYKKVNLVFGRKYYFKFQALNKKGQVIKTRNKNVKFVRAKSINVRF